MGDGTVAHPRYSLTAGSPNEGFDIVQHAFAPQGGGRIEDAARHRRPSRYFGVGCTEERIVDRRRLGFSMVFGRFSEKRSRFQDFTDFKTKSENFPDLV